MSGPKFRAHYDDDLDRWTVINARGEIEARCPDRRTAEDIAHAMTLNSVPGIDVCSNAA
jgi:hypothetical protein